MTDVEPTEMQKKAVDNALSGKFITKSGKSNIAGAMIDAGYSKGTANVPKHNLALKSGVQTYLKRIEERAKAKTGVDLRDQVMDGYLEGIKATTLKGKDAVEHPDYAVRKAYLDQFSSFFGWVENSNQSTPASVNQYNFFSVDEKKREAFNTNFRGFLKKYYKDA